MTQFLQKITFIALLFIAGNTQAQNQKPDQMPVYPGCEQAEKPMLCMRTNILDFIGKNFNSDLLHPIKDIDEVNIYVQFVIDSVGEIRSIKISTDYPDLKKEMLRVIKKLPSIKPAKSEGNSIDMQYEIPISFEIKKK